MQEYDRHLGPVNTVTFMDNGNRFVSTSGIAPARAALRPIHLAYALFHVLRGLLCAQPDYLCFDCECTCRLPRRGFCSSFSSALWHARSPGMGVGLRKPLDWNQDASLVLNPIRISPTPSLRSGGYGRR